MPQLLKKSPQSLSPPPLSRSTADVAGGKIARFPFLLTTMQTQKWILHVMCWRVVFFSSSFSPAGPPKQQPQTSAGKNTQPRHGGAQVAIFWQICSLDFPACSEAPTEYSCGRKWANFELLVGRFLGLSSIFTVLGKCCFGCGLCSF